MRWSADVGKEKPLKKDPLGAVTMSKFSPASSAFVRLKGFAPMEGNIS